MILLGPLPWIFGKTCMWNNYYINNFNFHTHTYGKDKSTMNYGVCVRSVDGMEYYGFLQEVIQLTYVGAKACYKTILFKCDWFDSFKGTNIHKQYKLIEINHTRKYPKCNPSYQHVKFNKCISLHIRAQKGAKIHGGWSVKSRQDQQLTLRWTIYGKLGGRGRNGRVQ